MRHRLLTIAVVAARGASACASVTDPAAGVSVAASAAAFTRPNSGGLIVPNTVANRSPSAVRLTGSCGDDPAAALEHRSGRGGWMAFGGARCTGLPLIGQLVLEPGAVRESMGGLNVVEPGEYRFVVETEQERVVSRAFTVR